MYAWSCGSAEVVPYPDTPCLRSSSASSCRHGGPRRIVAYSSTVYICGMTSTFHQEYPDAALASTPALPKLGVWSNFSGALTLCNLSGPDGPAWLVDRSVWDHALMDFDLAPPTGVGPLRIGMTRHAANTALDSLRDLSAISESDRPGQHVFRPSGLMISIHCVRDMLEATEMGRPSSQTDRVLFQGVDVFALPAREVVRRVGEFTSIEEDPEDDASFIAPDLLLSFWRPFAADDEPEEEQGYYFSSVLLARPGYYDTPAQAAERLQQSS